MCRIFLTLALLASFALAPIARAETIRISVAISLKDALTDIAKTYHDDTGENVLLTFGSSGQLLAQIKSGAEADAFISAAEKQITDLESANLAAAATRRIIARNTLVLVVPAAAKNPPDSFAALAHLPGKIALGEPQTVPAGAYAAETLTALKLLDALKPHLVYGASARQVLTYVETGNADAGLVYLTDAKASAKVRIVATADPATHAPIVYPAVTIKTSKKSAAVAKFFDYLAAEKSAAALAAKGFLRPATTPSSQPTTVPQP